MPYATPTSPLASPGKGASHHRKGWMSPPTHIEDTDAGPSYSTGPMPGIPRRSSSHQGSAASTPRHASPHMSRQASGSSTPVFAASKPMEGLPRRSSAGGTASQASSSSSSPTPAFGVAGLPNGVGESSTLGLKLHASPTKAPHMSRGIKDSISSTSTLESSLPSTPAEEPTSLPIASVVAADSPIKFEVEPTATKAKLSETPDATPAKAVPFPAFEPPPRRPIPHLHRAASHTRPTMVNARRNSAQGHHRGNGPTGSLQIPMPGSASTSHIPQPSSDATSSPLLRPTASMIRKKSGEVVKPSLKIRSMSTPDLTRQKDGEPQTPEDDANRDFPDERSKSVRFADADQEDPRALENVVLFLREQKVTAVGKAADPDWVGPVTDTETEADDTDASDFVQFRTRRNAAARAADEQGQLSLEGGSRVPRLRTDFSPDARGSLDGENVLLERVELVTGPGPLCLRGTVIVRNIAFQKWVSIRFTLDHWQTRSEVSGSHMSHIPSSTTGDQGWDRFGFTIKLEDFKRKIEDRQLIMCLRFSIGGEEWWDSNNGMNYNFTFKKTAPRRPTRVSGPAALGGQFARSTDLHSGPITGLRQRNHNTSPTAEISKAFGVVPSASKAGGPKNWIFPRAGTHHADTVPSRTDSPINAAPPTAYKVPAPPDVHTHLTLSKRYCAPSPPQSPPKEAQFKFTATEATTIISPALISPEHVKSEMNVMGGQFATLSPPKADMETERERRSSWGGKDESWDSFAKAMEHIDGEPSTPVASSTDGDSTPVAHGAQSPAGRGKRDSGTSSESSPERSRPLAFQRSTGDLQALLDGEDGSGLLTPPASNLSSPPSPAVPTLPAIPTEPEPETEPLSPMSSIASTASTGDSSPVNTVSTTDSIADLANLAIDVDPEERGRSMRQEYKMLNKDSYQDFLNKFCFFTSPRATPSDEPLYNRPTYIPLSGAASPNGFPFFSQTTNASSSPRSTPTPTRQYDSSQDAFNFSHQASAQSSNGGASTPRASPPNLSPSLGQSLSAAHWAGAKVESASPELAAN